MSDVDADDTQFAQQILSEVDVYAQGNWHRASTALCIIVQLGIRRLVPLVGPTKVREILGQLLDSAEKEFRARQN